MKTLDEFEIIKLQAIIHALDHKLNDLKLRVERGLRAEDFTVEVPTESLIEVIEFALIGARSEVESMMSNLLNKNKTEKQK